ncbi:MAG: hotdog fold thioesterase [Acidobacteria bacterium]|nr:hotdog fold thioesterase [Acidobacteriota bacterium]
MHLLAERTEGTVFVPLGIEIIEVTPERTRLALTIDHRHRQHLGFLHGGVSALLAESAASLAAASAVDIETHTVAGVDLSATHVRAKRDGRITATATPLHRGRTTHVYDVRITDEDDRLVCVARCTIAIRTMHR